jgi:hypothetical protein
MLEFLVSRQAFLLVNDWLMKISSNVLTFGQALPAVRERHYNLVISEEGKFQLALVDLPVYFSIRA